MHNIDLDERPRSHRELAAWYAAALEEQTTSGLSIAAYAYELGVSAATLYQWKRRLHKPLETYVDYEAPRSRGLVEVSLDNSPLPNEEERFIVRLSCGRCVEVPRRFEDADFARLLALLETC